jgi:RecB family exonuclease
MFIEHGIDAVPFAHEKMDEWRNNFKGIRHINEEAGYNFGGAVDDIWEKPNGDLIVIDVKSTSKNVFDWEDTYSKWEYAKGYRRQLEMYQWLLEKNGFNVAPEGYLVYYNGKKHEPMFNQQLTFDLHLVKLECDNSWVEEAVLSAKATLDGDMPKPSKSCENCNYLRKRWEVAQKDSDKLIK